MIIAEFHDTEAAEAAEEEYRRVFSQRQAPTSMSKFVSHGFVETLLRSAEAGFDHDDAFDRREECHALVRVPPLP